MLAVNHQHWYLSSVMHISISFFVERIRRSYILGFHATWATHSTRMPARGLRRHCPRISGRLEVQCVNFASRSCTAPKVPGVAPPQHDSHGVAELLVLNVPEPHCSSSISGNVPEWRYLGPHLRLPESSGFWPDCRLQFGLPIASFFSPAILPSLRVPVRMSEAGTVDIPAAAPLRAPSLVEIGCSAHLLARQASGTAS